MKLNLIHQIALKRGIKEDGLRSTLSRLKRKYDLTSIDQAACLYIKQHNLDINVSSIIDNITRQAMQFSTTKPLQQGNKTEPRIRKSRKPSIPIIKWLPTNLYAKADTLSDTYRYFYIFENALRIKIDEIMSSKDINWWESKVKQDLNKVYDYYEAEKTKQEKLPMIGSIDQMHPLDYLTIGHLEQIIGKYHDYFFPAVFPNEQFFTGHMYLIKRVRNGLAHMSPQTTNKDIVNTKHEIKILLEQLSSL